MHRIAQIAEAEVVLRKALLTLDKLWAAEPSSRTPRLAVAIRLLERAGEKLVKERREPSRAP